MTTNVNVFLIERVETLLKSVSFGEYTFYVREGHGGVFVQASYPEADTYSGAPGTQYTRKWLLSPEMTNSEILTTVFKLCATSFEHRCRESFKYKERRIFGPHFDVEDLVQICDAGREAAGGRDYQKRRIEP